MAEEIKAIQTYYNGYHFRSRLEARWAVFYDALGSYYLSEPEGFKLSNGDWYLPDFYLPDIDTYVEVKGIGAFSIDLGDDNDYIVPIEGRESPHKYIFAAHDLVMSGHNYAIVFGDPMDSIEKKSTNYFFHLAHCSLPTFNIIPDGCDCEQCDKKVFFAVDINPAFSSKKIVITQTIEQIKKAFPYHDAISFAIWPYNKKIKPFRTTYEEISEIVESEIVAALKARQARFEHGERP